MENKEQLRLKLIEAWSKRDIILYPEGDWGFRSTRTKSHNLYGLTQLEFLSAEFNIFAKSVALEIANFPLNKALT